MRQKLPVKTRLAAAGSYLWGRNWQAKNNARAKVYGLLDRITGVGNDSAKIAFERKRKEALQKIKAAKMHDARLVGAMKRMKRGYILDMQDNPVFLEDVVAELEKEKAAHLGLSSKATRERLARMKKSGKTRQGRKSGN